MMFSSGFMEATQDEILKGSVLSFMSMMEYCTRVAPRGRLRDEGEDQHDRSEQE